MRTCLSSSPLRIFDQGDGNQRISRFLDQINPPDSFSEPEAALLRIFLGADHRQILDGIDLGGINQVIKTTKQLMADTGFVKHMVIRTVFGATERMPLRALVYPLPAICLAEELGKMGIGGIPNIEYVFMLQAGITANNLNDQVVHQEADLLIDLIRTYVNQFHPQLSPHVSFSTDQDFTPAVMSSLDFARLVDILSREGNTDQLEVMGEKHGGFANSSAYGALHSYIHDLIPTNIQTDLIVSIGAQPERYFYQTRQTLKPHLNQIDGFRPINAIQYLAPFNVPPYQPMSNCDPLLSGVIRDPTSIDLSNAHTPVRQAVDILSRDIGSYYSFINFLKEHQKF